MRSFAVTFAKPLIGFSVPVWVPTARICTVMMPAPSASIHVPGEIHRLDRLQTRDDLAVVLGSGALRVGGIVGQRVQIRLVV
jgi:hypothetical protein